MKKGPYVEGLTEEIAPNTEKMLEIFRKGMRNRHIGATSMNIESSRSHSLFTIVVESKVKIS
jgi:Kinesin motor domain